MRYDFNIFNKNLVFIIYFYHILSYTKLYLLLNSEK